MCSVLTTSKIFHPRESRRRNSDRDSNRIDSRLSIIDERRDLESVQSSAMSDQVDVIFKSLRLLPDFDGNPHVLTRFINLCDRLVLEHYNDGPGHELANLSLLNGILNKVTGPAARLINSNGIPDNWSRIRDALINNFADHRDETALYSDLSLQTQGSSTPQEFYERCQNLFSTIMTYVSLHESVPTTVEAKRTLYAKLTLQAYLRGLKDPLGSRIRCMRPGTMEIALQFVQEEVNTLYIQQRNEGGHGRKEWQPQHTNNFKMPLHSNLPMIRTPAFNMPGPSTQPIYSATGQPRHQPMLPQATHGWRPQQSQMHSFRGPTRTQQIFRAPPPNYQSQNNTFAMPFRPQNQSANSNVPRPMSGVSHFVSKPLPLTGRDWRTHGNPPPNNYFKTREVNFNESGYDYDIQYDYDNSYPEYDQFYYTCEQYPEYYDCSYENPTSTVVEEIGNLTTPEQQDFQKEPSSDKQK